MQENDDFFVNKVMFVKTKTTFITFKLFNHEKKYFNCPRASIHVRFIK